MGGTKRRGTSYEGWAKRGQRETLLGYWNWTCYSVAQKCSIPGR